VFPDHPPRTLLAFTSISYFALACYHSVFIRCRNHCRASTKTSIATTSYTTHISNNMSASKPALSNNIKYYSAYRGPVHGADGKFHHFARQCDPEHEKNGYWRFATYGDDQRAHLRGFCNPEEILQAQNAGDGQYDDIFLLWVPGNLDNDNKTSIGTAAMHLKTIYNERKLLGKTLAFRGAVPLYPISTDPRLLQYRLTRYGIQKGKLPDDLLSPTSRPPHMQSMQPVSLAPPPSMTITPMDRSSRATGHESRAKSFLAEKVQSSPAQSNTAQSSPSSPAPVALSYDGNPVRSSASVAATHALRSKAHSISLECLQASLPIQPQDRIDSPLDPANIDMERQSTISKNLGNLAVHQSEEPFFVDDDGGCRMKNNDVTITKDAVGTVEMLSLTDSMPGDMFHAQASSLPCMDCGLSESHTSACWFNDFATNLKIHEDLTKAELHSLVEQVTDFDPAPWTTHHGPPEQIAEDPELLLRSMAETIRNLDEKAQDSDLQGLNDQSTILRWALKSVGEVQVHGEDGETLGIEMLDW
jgi:hypothetical protein